MASVIFGGTPTTDRTEQEGRPKKPRSLARKSGLMFSPLRVGRAIKHKSFQIVKNVRKKASIYAAAIGEYLMAEVLELAGYSARDHKRKRITPRDVMVAMRADSELNALLGRKDKTIFPSTGVLAAEEKARQIAALRKVKDGQTLKIVEKRKQQQKAKKAAKKPPIREQSIEV